VKDDKVICDNCSNYFQHPSGCTEGCWENLKNPFYMTQYYYEQRRDGYKKSCKGFKPLPNPQNKILIDFHVKGKV